MTNIEAVDLGDGVADPDPVELLLAPPRVNRGFPAPESPRRCPELR
jgi:hypothetical protein